MDCMHLVSHQAYILERAYNVPNKKNLPLTKFFHIGVLGNAFLSFTHGAALKSVLCRCGEYEARKLLVFFGCRRDMNLQ